MKITLQEAASAINGSIITGNDEYFFSERTATDSNKAEEKSLFIPIIGARTDGHNYIRGAFENGAAAALTSEDLPEDIINYAKDNKKGIIKTDNTVEALQKLGAYYREKYVHIPYIGITGSVGKTTTREMTACAVSAGLDTYSTKGNANSQTGVPITVMATPENAEAGVIEMGMSEFGEMHRLSEIVKCDLAVITVIGISHIANLGSQENIMKEKLHILDGMKDGAALLLNGDDTMLKELDEQKIHGFGIACGKKINIIFYGTGENAFYRASDIKETDEGSEFCITAGGKNAVNARLNVPGRHMILNALAAAAAADIIGVGIERAAEKLQAFASLDGRGRMTESRGIKIINDAYNAAPQSMKAGLSVLDGIKTEKDKKHIAVMADMLELGPDENAYHEEIGRFIAEKTSNIDNVCLYGDLSINILNGLRKAAEDLGADCTENGGIVSIAFVSGRKITAVHFETFEELKKYVFSAAGSGDAVFFKGSNSMKLWSMAKDLIGE